MYGNHVVWELRVSKTDELIATYSDESLDNFEFKKQSIEVKKKIKKIVSKYYNFEEEDFDEWDTYIAIIGAEAEEKGMIDKMETDFSTKKDFEITDDDFEACPLYFLGTIKKDNTYNYKNTSNIEEICRTIAADLLQNYESYENILNSLNEISEDDETDITILATLFERLFK